MKRKFSSQIALPADATPSEIVIFKQVKDITDDLATALDNGLTFSENVRSVIKSVPLNSGVEVDLGTLKKGTVRGAFILHTDGATVTSFKSRYGSTGNILVTASFTPTPANITFIVIGE